MGVKNTLEDALKQSMREKDEMRRNALRMALSSIKLAEVEAGKELDDLSVFSILQKEIKTKEETIHEAEKAGRLEMIPPVKNEIDYLKSFLPKELTDSELRQLVQKIIEDTGAQSIKEMGMVMKIAIEQTAGRASNDRISKLVKEMLNPQ